MIKRTPQEIADFFQCYVAQDSTGYWFVYEDRPRPSAIYELWNSSTGDRSCIFSRLINVPAVHDWTHLYEPRPLSEKVDSYNYEGDLYKEIRDFIKFFKERQESINPRNIIPESGNINEESGRNCQKHDLCHQQSEVNTQNEYRVMEEPQRNQGKTEEDFPKYEPVDSPHIGEVYIHKEYDVISSDDLSRMKHDISALMEQGWKLQGGIAVEHLSMADGYVNDVPVFYQAMVRGV